ncbi:MAG: GTPase HflX [Planctomycetota bacterium]|jgi:GTP-binding protein HflX|nr:GTPase HflX [Planctomycetota bacterium]MDP6408653.1 GTPase HflX [Planctomycetota bacterium]MDP6540946.1 GTPase HflX [Planctomycetota bacterium]
MSREPRPTLPPRERVLVCGVLLGDQRPEHEGPLSEVRGLVRAADGEVVGPGIVQRRERPHPATLMGKGKAQEVADAVQSMHPDAVVVDNDLTPAQGRNLEKIWGVRVIDRSELILDIFARRARTRQASLQVELAQNEYLFPRLRRMWTHLERTEGAIGARGPGETQLETDRRLLRKRIRDLKAELDQIEQRRMREVRTRTDVFTIGLVGYTNAGKSTLLNRLTGSREFVADMLFATLDTRTRQWELSDGRIVLLSDTVGFLGRLPHHLVASFHATLEEALTADVLLHVVDGAHPDAAGQMAAVERVLGELSHHTHADVLVFNKIDHVGDGIELALLSSDREESVVYLSAATGEGLDRLDAVVRERLDARSALLDLFLPLADGRLAASVRGVGGVLEEEVIGDAELRLRVRLDAGALGNLRRQAAGELRFELLEPPREGIDGLAAFEFPTEPA